MLEKLPRTLYWENGALFLLDERRLPHETAYLECTLSGQVCDAIAQLAVRGAPAIGDAGAYAVALWCLNERPADEAAFEAAFAEYASAYREGRATGLARDDMAACIADVQLMIDERYAPEVEETEPVLVIGATATPQS